MTNIYGIFPIDLFQKIWKMHNDGDEPDDAIFNALIIPSWDRYPYYEKINNYIVSEYLIEFDLWAEVLEKSSGYQYFIPDLKELLYYSIHEYDEDSLQYQKLYDFFGKKISKDTSFDNLILGLYNLCTEDAPISQLMEEVNEEGVVFEKQEEGNTMLQILMDYSNHSRKWITKGNKPEELFEKEKPFLKPLPKEPFQITKQAKVYPNEPCPCGSGKKYKKCCGG